MVYLTDFIGLLTVALVTFFLIFDYKKNNGKLTSFQAINVSFSLYYILVPFLIRHYNIKPSLLSFSDMHHLMAQSWVLLGYLVFLFIYFVVLVVIKKRQTKSKTVQKDVDSLDNIIKITKFIFYIGLVSNLYFYLKMGGIGSVLSMVESLRVDPEYNNYIYTVPFLSVAKMLMPTINIAFFMYLYLFSKGIKKYKFHFIVSVFFVVVFILFNASKLHALFTILSVIIFFAFSKNKKVLFKLCLLAISALIMIEPLNNLFYYLQYKEFPGNTGTNLSIVSYFSEFFFPYSNLLHVETFTNNNGLRWGYDFIAVFVDVLPSGILSSIGISEPIPSHLFNTYNYNGGVWNGGMPTDLITLGYYQFREIGIILIFVILAISSVLFDSLLKRIKYEKGEFLLRFRALIFFFLIIPYADPLPLLRSRIDYLFFVLLLIYLIKKEKNKPS